MRELLCGRQLSFEAHEADLRVVEVIAPGLDVLYSFFLHRVLKHARKDFFSKLWRSGDIHLSTTVHIYFYDERRAIFLDEHHRLSFSLGLVLESLHLMPPLFRTAQKAVTVLEADVAELRRDYTPFDLGSSNGLHIPCVQPALGFFRIWTQ
jgi:hypothetical protein